MITSRSNAQIKKIMHLKKSVKERDAQGVFFAEGIKMLREAPPARVRMVYASASFASGKENARLLEGVPHEIVTDEIFTGIADTRTPQGVISLVEQRHFQPQDLLTTERTPLLLALETLQDPGNLGTIVRMAEGAGVTGILLSGDCVDIYNPKVIRSTMGSIYRMPFCYVEDLRPWLILWKKRGIRLFAAHLQGRAAYEEEDYTLPAAFMIGNESRGLTDGTSGLADRLIRIPMQGQVESLNAAVAASILAFEAARQRRAAAGSRAACTDRGDR